MKKTIQIFACVLLSLMVALPAGASKLTEAAKRSSVPEFELQDLKGNMRSLSEFKGKVTVVSFWATWCEPCKQELGFMKKFRKTYGEQGFEVLAVATDAPETRSKVRTIVKRKKWKNPILMDTEGSVSALLNPRGAMPYAMFIDRQGRLAYAHEAYASGDEVAYEEAIKALLAEK